MFDMGGQEFHLLYSGVFQSQPGWIATARIVWCAYLVIAMFALTAMGAKSAAKAALVGVVGALGLTAVGNVLYGREPRGDLAVVFALSGSLMAVTGGLAHVLARPLGAFSRAVCVAWPGAVSLLMMAGDARTPQQFVRQLEAMSLLQLLLSLVLSTVVSGRLRSAAWR